jgi:hypothetical protein
VTSKEKAQGLWGIVMDRTRSNAEHRAALDELLALKKAKKTTLDKLGVPQVMWDREDETNRKHAEMAQDMGQDEATDAALLREQHADFIMSDAELAMQVGRKRPDEEEPKTTGPTPTELKSHVPDPVLPVVQSGADLTPEVAQQSQAAAEERGQISKTVRHMLLNTDHPYARMVELIRAKHPSAKTTARSIASVASDMRRAGYAVRERSKDAA